MELPTGRFNGDREEMSPSPAFQPPTYAIRVAQDKSLQWDPPADSEELALALSYHFPLPKTLEAKMQAATKKWLRARAARHSTNTSLVHKHVKAKKLAEKNIYGQIQVLSDQDRQPPRLRHPKGNISSIRSSNSRDESGDRITSSQQPSNCNARDGSTEGCNKNPPALDRRLDIPRVISWKVDTGEIAQRTAKKRPYSDNERLMVAKNRGNACADHRRRRQKVKFPFQGLRYI